MTMTVRWFALTFEEGRLSEDEEVHRTQSHDPVDFLRFLLFGRLLFCEG